MHLVHMGSPALQGSCPLVALEGVGCQRGGVAPQAGLLQRGNALLRQPCTHTNVDVSALCHPSQLRESLAWWRCRGKLLMSALSVTRYNSGNHMHGGGVGAKC